MITEYKGELLLYPCPTVLVTSKAEIENVFTVSWTGIASSHPEYITIAINRKRYSHSLIKNTGKFCINIPDTGMIREVDYCGTVSGRDVDKFAKCQFTKTYYQDDYIIIDQCLFHIMCNVVSVVELGSHDLFIAEVVKKWMNSSIRDIHQEADPIIYFRPNYYKINKEKIGEYGFVKNQS